ncbi:hypothetical protein Q5I06_03375 [Helicobacter sp. faydin-H76]|uniref:Uncharacterized protein n=1 Tax=Helicobacter cappadocius TaxID=3063998 RepID=A0AA90T4X3_9HELI|nr:hypothetical protein [Helicobacter sp. faydin-H76]MDP2538823.1 hypothetical protein [Helicobacter sp. faydin-H76]
MNPINIIGKELKNGMGHHHFTHSQFDTAYSGLAKRQKQEALSKKADF